MPRSTVLIVLTVLLTAGVFPSQALCDGTRSQARQTFRIHIPGSIRIVGTNADVNGQPQSVRISAAIDVAVSVHDVRFRIEQPSFDLLILGGQTVSVPITQTIDGDQNQPLPRLTILPGW